MSGVAGKADMTGIRGERGLCYHSGRKGRSLLVGFLGDLRVFV